jgi:hypothetical protein
VAKGIREDSFQADKNVGISVAVNAPIIHMLLATPSAFQKGKGIEPEHEHGFVTFTVGASGSLVLSADCTHRVFVFVS